MSSRPGAPEVTRPRESAPSVTHSRPDARPWRSAWAGSAAAAALAALTAACFAPRVAPFTTDSESYLDVARNLLAGEGLVQRVVDFWRPALPDPLGMWPPGYPLAVALAARSGLEVESAARAVSIAALIGFAIAFHLLARRAAGAGWGAFATALALTTPRVARAGVMAWSEMLYLALATAGLLGLARLAEATRAPPGAERRLPSALPAAIAGLAIGLAATTRYVGVLLVPLGLAVWLRSRADGASRALWLAGATIPPMLWAIHNLAHFGSFSGPPAVRSVPDVLGAVASGLRWGLLPQVWGAQMVLAALALAGLGIALVVAWRRGGVAALVAGYAVLYLLAHLALRAMADRFLVPVDPFLWLVAAVALAALDRRGALARLAARAVAAALLVGMIAGLGRALRDSPSSAGIGSLSPAFHLQRDAELDALRRVLPAAGPPVLSDAGHRVRSATGRAAVQIPPPRFRLREFTADDERRWRAAGVREAVLRRWQGTAPSALGEHIAARIRAGRWTVLDSSASFVRYRLP
jgi:hypothetical protein